MIPFGAKVKHKYTPLEGIVVARTEWMNGCVQSEVVPNALKDGEPIKVWVDDDDLEVISCLTETEVNGPTGGDRSDHPTGPD